MSRRGPLVAAALAVVLLASGAAALPAGSRAALPQGVLEPSAANVAVNASASTNWFGYNLGSVSRDERFSSIAGTWVVPRARQHTRGRAEFSSTWIGIGGGCVDTKCSRVDSTLIQVGTESNVTSDGRATYGAWWELIPAPAVSAPMLVHPGDKMRAAITETLPNIWRISLRNLTTRDSWAITVPYLSTKATAEWIVETPIVVGTSNQGLASLPRLSRVTFDDARVNGRNPKLRSAERVYLVRGSRVIGRPTKPQKDRDGFGACSWTSTCKVPKELGR